MESTLVFQPRVHVPGPLTSHSPPATLREVLQGPRKKLSSHTETSLFTATLVCASMAVVLGIISMEDDDKETKKRSTQSTVAGVAAVLFGVVTCGLLVVTATRKYRFMT